MKPRLQRELLGLRLTSWGWLTALAVALLLFGDRLKLARPDPARLVFSHTFTTQSEQAILDRVVTEFEAAHPGVRVEQIVANSEVYNTVGWRLQFQGRNQPDIYFHWQGFKVGQCIANGWAMDLRPHLSAGFLDQFVPSSLREQRGGLHFLPHSIDVCNLVWHDRDLFARLGLKEPRTFEDWLALCQRVRAEGILPLAQGNRDLWPMGNFGAELVGQALGAAATDTLFEAGAEVATRARQAFGPLEAMRTAGCFDLPGVLEPGAIGQLGDIDAKVLFLGGKSAMHILGSWFLADINDAREKGELKFEVGVFPVPAAAGETDALAGVTTGYLVNPRTANPKAAVAFLELLLSRKYQAEFAKLGSLSMRRDAAEFVEQPLAKKMLAILNDARVIVPPPDTGYRPDQANTFYEVVARLLTGRLPLDDAGSWWSEQKLALAKKGL